MLMKGFGRLHNPFPVQGTNGIKNDSPVMAAPVIKLILAILFNF